MNFPDQEKQTLEFWKDKDIFQKTLQKDSPKGSFVFFEGPPTANGKPGIHHAESRAYKDCIPRFKTMQGFHVIRKAGWDTHGLPVEIEVEKQLGFKSKSEIEAYGIAQFNKQCRESVWAYKKDWEDFTLRLGYWVDLDQAYITYESNYIESLWWIIKQVWEKNLLYKDYRVTPHCPRCGTSLSSHELSQGYADVKDLTITAGFLVTESTFEILKSDVPTMLLAWTTTPWTLPGNVALAVGPKLAYVLIEKELEEGKKVRYVLAKALLPTIFPDAAYTIVQEMQGADLVGTQYQPLYPYLEKLVTGENVEKLSNIAYRVHPADFVTTEDGTGIVHTAVMYGADDFDLGNKIGLPKQHVVNLDGTFVAGTDFLAGRFVADEDVAIDIIKDLAGRGLLFSKAKYEHSYPHCWRCKTKVIYFAKDSWYIRMSELREKMLAENANIHWVPDHLQEGRFGEWLREVKDWAFSRERYWGTPLPIWESVDGEKLCIGSFEELRSLAKDPTLVGDAFDPHRPFVDDVVLVKDGKEFSRVKDVCDVWFDSGAMPFAQWHYPFENKELIETGTAYPADYISEAIDQTRGWFYTLLAVATLLGKERPFKNVICLGHVLDANGKKMSKSLGNIVKPMDMIDLYGADAVRWYMYTINQPGESKRFDEKTLSEMVKKNFTILMNVVSFYEMFAAEKTETVSERTNILDRWVIARLNKLVLETTERLEKYSVTESVRELGSFINDLSTWYVRRSRDRFKGLDAADKSAAIQTLQECLLTLAKLMAPFTPFLAEEVYRLSGGDRESVHLEDWPTVSTEVEQNVLDVMGQTRAIVSRALERRAEAGIPVRQVLNEMVIHVPSGALDEAYQEVLKDEVNVKTILMEKGDLAVFLDLKLTPELVREGTVREIIRRVNAMRKNAGLTIEDRIQLYVAADDQIKQAIEEHKDVLLHGTLSVGVRVDGDVPEINESFRANEFDLVVGFEKV